MIAHPWLPSCKLTWCGTTLPLPTSHHLVLRIETIHDLPSINSHNNMNTNNFFFLISGCLHSRTGTTDFFPSQTVLLCHLNSTSHISTHSMANHSNCAALGIYSCCTILCLLSPKTFFSSFHALDDHCAEAHPPPPPPPPAPNTLPPDTNHSSLS